jgi:hypothetical protein
MNLGDSRSRRRTRDVFFGGRELIASELLGSTSVKLSSASAYLPACSLSYHGWGELPFFDTKNNHPFVVLQRRSYRSGFLI